MCDQDVFESYPILSLPVEKRGGNVIIVEKKKIMKKITLWLRSISHPEEEVEWKQVPFVTLILLHLLCSRNILFIKSYLRK